MRVRALGVLGKSPSFEAVILAFVGASVLSGIIYSRALFFFNAPTLRLTCSLHCSYFFGLPFRILDMELVKPKKGTTMETIGRPTAEGLDQFGVPIF